MDHSGQLFERAPLLEWLPDESLFSLVSRIHSLSGRDLARRTSERLFGSRQAGIHHDFPNSLGEFEHRTDALLGTAKQIAEERTLLKYYRSFTPKADSAAVTETLRGSSVAHLKFRLGLITSRFRANHPLKACPSCMAEDLAQHGWAYWRMSHQFPGIWWCRDHGCLLQESFLKSTGVGRFLWHLPNPEALRQWPYAEGQYKDAAEKAVAGLADTAMGLVAVGASVPFDTNRFWLVYREELDRRGWLTNGERLRFADMVPAFLSYAARLRFLPELSTLPTTAEAATAQLGRMFRRPRSGTHPLRHALLINWLFDDVGKFVERYQRLSTSRSDPSRTESTAAVDDRDTEMEDPHVSRLLQLLETPGTSMRAAAREVGVDIKTAMAWAAKAGHSTSRRPKVLKPQKREALIELLRAGTDKLEVAEKVGVSVSSVTRILRTEPGLQSRWHEARLEQAQRHARATWKALVTRFPRLGIKLLRAQEPAVYAWLYRNDREWLRAHSMSANEASRVRGSSSVSWDKRDASLSAEVLRVTLDLITANPGARIFLWQLYQQIPELKAKLDVLHRLPLTKEAIERALTRLNLPSGGLF